MSGYLSGLLFSFSCRQHDHLVRFAEVKSRWANQIADIFNEKQTVRPERQLIERMADHVRIWTAALAGIDLHGRGTGGANPIRVTRGLLIAFNDGDRPSALYIDNRADKQRCLRSEPGLETRLSAKMLSFRNRARLDACEPVVLRQDVRVRC